MSAPATVAVVTKKSRHSNISGAIPVLPARNISPPAQDQSLPASVGPSPSAPKQPLTHTDKIPLSEPRRAEVLGHVTIVALDQSQHARHAVRRGDELTECPPICCIAGKELAKAGDV